MITRPGFRSLDTGGVLALRNEYSKFNWNQSVYVNEHGKYFITVMRVIDLRFRHRPNDNRVLHQPGSERKLVYASRPCFLSSVGH